MVTERELDRIRADAERLLLGSCTISERQLVSDGGGGHTEQWVETGTVRCRIAPVGGGVKGVTGDRVSDDTTHVITLPSHTGLTKTSRIEVEGAGTYDITLIRERTFDELVRRVEVREADSET